MKIAVLLVAAVVLTGCAEASPEQTVNVLPSRPPGLVSTPVKGADALAYLRENRGRWKHEETGGDAARNLAVVLATGRDKDSWQAVVVTATGTYDTIEATSYSCGDPSVADVLMQSGDLISYYDRSDGTVSVGDQDGYCGHLSHVHVLEKAAVASG